MKCTTLNSFSFLTLVLGVVACAPVDHVVASNQSGAGSSDGVGGDKGQGASAGVAPTTNSTTAPASGGAPSSWIHPVETLGGGGMGGASQGTSNSTPPATGGSTQTTSTPASCAEFADTTSAHPIEVTIKNERSTPVYVGNRESQCSNDQTLRLFELTSGRELTLDGSGRCGCERMMEWHSCPVFACMRTPLVRIDPNASISLTWSGTHAVNRAIPSECGGTNELSSTCTQMVGAAPGRYKLSVTGSSKYGCEDGWDPADCSCMATNSCNPNDYKPLEGEGELLEPSIEFDLLSTDTLTLSFTEDTGATPSKNGVPIGNCRERTAAEQTALGCPVEKPTPGGVCSTPAGVACHYGIEVFPKTTSESVFLCGSDGKWNPGSVQNCGQICDYIGSNAIEFTGIDCGARPIVNCSEPTDSVAAFEPTSQMELDSALTRALTTCHGQPYVGIADLEVVNGCATRLVSVAPFSAEVTDCLRKTFESVRFDCARQLSCSSYAATYIDG